MKNYAKKYLSLFVAVLMAVTMLVPAAAFADTYTGGETYNDEFTFTTSDNVIEIGDTTDITATITDSTFGNAANLTYESSDPTVATVSGDGTATATVTGVSSGYTTITATLTETGDETNTVTATVTIYVYSVYDTQFSGIELNDDLVLLQDDDTFDFNASATDSSEGTLDSDYIVWTSSDDSIATVDEDGVVTPTGDASGVVTITATYACEGTPSASATVYVQQTGQSLINKAQFTEDTVALENVGDTDAVTVTAYMKDGSEIPSEIVEQLVDITSSNENVATVVGVDDDDDTEYGTVTAIGVGTTTLKIVPYGVTGGSAYDTCTVTVSNKLVEDIDITADNSAPDISDTVTLTATVTDADATDPSVTWSSNSVASVTAKDAEDDQAENVSKATVTFNTFGHAVITATANDGSGVTGTIEFDVTGFELLQSAMDVNKGDSFTAPYSYYGIDLSDVTWSSSNTSVATVDENGYIEVVGYGTATISAKYGDEVQTLELTSAEDNGTAVYRLYNRNSGEHFYTTDSDERDYLVSLGWKDEGIGWYGASEDDGVAVYRLYNAIGGEHHYTTDEDEKDTLVSAGWSYEGIEFYASSTTTDYPVYRNYNPNAFSNNHNFTTNEEEYTGLIEIGWDDEGVAFYAVNPGSNG